MARTRLPTLLLYPLGFFGLCLLVQRHSGVATSDLVMYPDEPSHFVSALMIYDFVRGGAWGNPMGFAIDYYLHFPKVAIGHWPPFFHVMQAIAFFVFGRSLETAHLFQALIAGFAAGIPAMVMHRRAGLVAGLATGATVALSPLAMYWANGVMLDLLIGLLVLVATLAWARYWQTRTLGWAMAFALLAAAAIMTKANALGLAALPVLHCALTRDGRVLLTWKTWCAALLVGVIVVPWLALTYRITADGLVQSWGWDYTSEALTTYPAGFPVMAGWPVTAGLIVGAGYVLKPSRARTDPILVALLAAIAGMLVLLFLVPSDTLVRYLLTVLPMVAVVATTGLIWAARAAAARFAVGRHISTIASALMAAAVAASLASVFALPRAPHWHLRQVVTDIRAAGTPNPLVLASGSTRLEGGLTAAFANAEPDRRHYVIRGSAALASSNFSGTSYRLRFETVPEMGQFLADSQIGWVVIDTAPASTMWPDHAALIALAAQPSWGWTLVGTYPREGAEIRLYRLPAADQTPQDMDRLLRLVSPTKLIGR
jgi:hypothetical protein